MYNQNIRRFFQYHEQKVTKGDAELIYAVNYLRDKQDLTIDDKMYPFWQRASLNEQVRARILHIVLTFDPKDNLPYSRMGLIAQEYLEKMGWHNESFVVYQHNDTGQPHLHIGTPKIQSDGKRLVVTKQDYHRSKREVKLLEKKYTLRPSDSLDEMLRRMALQKIRFGQTPLWPAMNKILEEVVPRYHFTSLEDFNALLRLYNLKASRGKSNTATYKNGGLLYIPLAESGKEMGGWFKASMFRSQPTLKNLEKVFARSQTLREPHRLRQTVEIDYALERSISLETFRKILEEKENISTVLKRNTNGEPQAIWYVDHYKRTIFEGAALGPEYTAAAVAKRCISQKEYESQQQTKTQRHYPRIT